MRIAFITQPWDTIYPSENGGTSSIPMIIYQIARRMVDAGHDVLVYSKRAEGQPELELDENGILNKRISLNTEDQLMRPLKLLDRRGFLFDPKKPFYSSRYYYLGFATQIARDICKENVQIVHIINFSQFVPVVRRHNPQAKIVLHMECEWLTQLDRGLIDRRINQSDLIVGCSDYITNKIKTDFPQHADRCVTIYNGVDIQKFDVLELEDEGPRTSKTLLFIGRISPEKGVHILLKAFQKVSEAYPHTRVDIVGPFGSAPYEFVVLISDDPKVASLAAYYNPSTKREDYQLKLQELTRPEFAEQINFAGNVSHPELPRIYHQADVFLFTSVWDEPFGIPIIEAMACGLPVVAARGGAVPEIVQDGVTGYLVERDDPDSMAHGIIRMLEDESVQRSMGEAGRRRVCEVFTWDRVADQFRGHYENLTNVPAVIG